jgi:hypothetical protein
MVSIKLRRAVHGQPSQTGADDDDDDGDRFLGRIYQETKE